MNLFKAFTQGIKKVVETVIDVFKDTKSVNTDKPLSDVIKFAESRNLNDMKEKYRPLFELAQTKYDAISELGLGEYSSAYQNAGKGFNMSEINTVEEMFNEVARAQVFTTDSTSNIDVIKKYIEDAGISMYQGRGNGDDNMKNFWSAINRAKETSALRTAIELKRYSGAFEYAFKVWNEGGSEEDMVRAINKFLEDEYNIYSTNIMTDNALKYETPEEQSGLYM